MKIASMGGRGHIFRGPSRGLLLIAIAGLAGILNAPAHAQDAPAKPGNAADEAQDAPGAAVSFTSTPEERSHEAWTILTEAVGDLKHPQTRIQALAALGLMRSPRSSRMIVDAMADPDLDVRTAGVLSAGQTRDRNLTTDLRRLLDDKEPQVAFTAAMTLWKMNDRSGEDILMAVVDGERSAGPTMVNGTKHKLSRDLHNPAMLAKLGAMQGAAMLLGPFGYGITAYEYIRQNGGDLARAAAIEQLAQDSTAPIHKELLAALGDKDPTVRAAAVKALASYRDEATSTAIYALFADPKNPVRLTSAAAYLRTTGTPGPSEVPVVPAPRNEKARR